jgi:rSAM/selenodomain-associated transferase 1
VSSVALLVIAKEPLPGRAKTRLTPPCTAGQAAELAGASLLDTLDVVERTPAARRVLVFDGDARRWRRPGFELMPQRGAGLGGRLAAAFDDVGCAALLIGMDTPQLTPGLLRAGMRALSRPDVDAVLGPTVDGGYWSVGFSSRVPGAFTDVPMSSASTCSRQRARLHALGLRVDEQPLLRDVDTFDDAQAVARVAPHTHFARALAAID